MEVKNKKLWLLSSYMLIVASLFVTNPILAQLEPDEYQKPFLERDIKNRLDQLMAYWISADYVGMYQELAATKNYKDINIEEFSQRLLQKKWQPVAGRYKIIQINFIGLSRALVEAEVFFNHKRNKQNLAKTTIVLHFIYELQYFYNWNIDLLRLLSEPHNLN